MGSKSYRRAIRRMACRAINSFAVPANRVVTRQPIKTRAEKARGEPLRSRAIQRGKAQTWHCKARASEMRGIRLWRFVQARFSLTQKMFPQTTSRVTKKSGSAHMKSIWSVAACQAMNLMIGCKPNANSQADFGFSERVNETPRRRMMSVSAQDRIAGRPVTHQNP